MKTRIALVAVSLALAAGCTTYDLEPTAAANPSALRVNGLQLPSQGANPCAPGVACIYSSPSDAGLTRALYVAAGDAGVTSPIGPGPTGPTGPTGLGTTGLTGGFTIDHAWSSSTSAPGSNAGTVNLDNATASSATHVYFTKADVNSADVTGVLAQLAPGYLLHLFVSSSTWVDYAVTGTTSSTNYYTVAVTYVSGTSWSPTGSATVHSGIAPAGTTGAAGSNGTNGTNGSNGAVGPTGGFSTMHTWASSTSTPGSNDGSVRFDNSTFASVAHVYFTKNDANSSDVSSLLALITSGTHLHLFFNGTTWADFVITGTSSSTNYYSFAVTPTSTGGSFTATSGNVSWGFALAGPSGVTGPTGSAGTPTCFTLNTTDASFHTIATYSVSGSSSGHGLSVLGWVVAAPSGSSASASSTVFITTNVSGTASAGISFGGFTSGSYSVSSSTSGTNGLYQVKNSSGTNTNWTYCETPGTNTAF